jgi:hypothetical protein
MTPDQWQDIKDKLQAVLELEPPERSAHLEDIAAPPQSFARNSSPYWFPRAGYRPTF